MKLSPLTIGLFEMHFLKNKSIVKMLLMQVILSGTVRMLSENNGEDTAMIRNEKSIRIENIIANI